PRPVRQSTAARVFLARTARSAGAVDRRRPFLAPRTRAMGTLRLGAVVRSAGCAANVLVGGVGLEFQPRSLFVASPWPSPRLQCDDHFTRGGTRGPPSMRRKGTSGLRCALRKYAAFSSRRAAYPATGSELQCHDGPGARSVLYYPCSLDISCRPLLTRKVLRRDLVRLLI